jgi:dUTP pyrophosphatase
MEKLKVKKLHEDAIIPEYKTVGSAGMDISSIQNVIIYPSQVELVSTGISVEIPEGYEIQVRPRSGLAYKNKITVLNTPGTIDSDYRGEIKVLLYNVSKDMFEVKKGDRIAQLVVNKVEQPEIEVVSETSDTQRGEGGFGSTGV